MFSYIKYTLPRYYLNDFVCLTIFTAGFEEIKCPIFSEILLNPGAVNDEMHIGAKPFKKSDLISNFQISTIWQEISKKNL